MYWESVLKEVRNRNATSRFTNLSCASTGVKTSAYQKKKAIKKDNAFTNDADIKFSRREAECMEHFLQGRTVAEVADLLGLSRRTVEFYVKNMRAKVGCRTKAELIQIVLDGNIVLLS
ncbi:MAG: helix-turn-helix transcriptional regulator [Gammaproteobacteria bacterium]|nr:helix-turn-helix transcriptional regulator [Gammaproteobacteria bacterium]